MRAKGYDFCGDMQLLLLLIKIERHWANSKCDFSHTQVCMQTVEDVIKIKT